MKGKSMNDQVLKLKREINYLKAQNKQQINYSMDFFDDTSNNSLRGIKKVSNTSTHKSQKQFSLSSNYHPKVINKKGKFSLVNSISKKERKGTYSQVTNSSKSTQLIKVPILKGMFSYKKSFIDEDKKSKFNLNSSMMSQDVKINLFDDININDGLTVNNMKHHQSSNSIDLSKYKIRSSQASSSVIGLSHKNSTTAITQNTKNNVIESYQINNPMTRLNIENNVLSPIQGRLTNYNNSTVIQNSMQLSPVIINNINLQSTANDIKGNLITTESLAYFKQKPRNERESRRMMIELVKLKQQKTKEPVDSLLAGLNINNRVLEQEKKSVKHSQSNSIYLPLRNPQSNYLNTPSLLPNRTKSMSSLEQMHRFISEMNDENKERINMINYLSVPRIMSLINNNSVPYIFVLSPNSICHLYGIETYVFKWREFKDGVNNGYFDLLKVINCSKNKLYPNHFIIQIEDTNDNGLKTYEIEAASLEICKHYVDCLNFLSQLIKCKAFKRIGNFSPN